MSGARPISSHRVKQSLNRFVIHAILFTASLACLLPLLIIISASFSDEIDIANYGYSLIPLHFTTMAYDYLLKVPVQIVRAYGVTIFVTVVGTVISLFIMSLMAYVLSRRDTPFRKTLSFIVFFTMLFNGGLVPFYIWITQGLHLQDSIWVLILPYLFVPWYVLLLRTYFAGLPEEIFDSAKVDGAGEWRIFFQFVVPLSTPSLATVGLFCILQYWNDWWLALLFINKQELQPLQYMLQSIMTNSRAIMANPQSTGIPLPLNTVRMAMAVLATGPAALAFLLLQRYFLQGLTLGALK
jgi:putative aldouronate transport system permease protein